MTDTMRRLSGATATTVAKSPVRGATTANVTLSGYQTIDGVAFLAADEAAGRNMRVLVKDQTDVTQNGIYLVNSGLWTRTPDFDGNTDFVKGSSVYVTDGTLNGGSTFIVTSADPQNIGISSITFGRTSAAGLTVEYFGVVPGIPSDPVTVAAANTAAMEDALTYCAANGVSKLYAPSQYYVFSGEGIRIPNGIEIIGSGVGLWDCIFPARPKTWTGTNFIAYGTGTKVEAITGVTDRSVSGGTRSDGSLSFSLTNFMNTDGSGTTVATPRAFSAFIAPLTRADDTTHAFHWGLRDIRIVPWLGTDGTSDWSTTGTTLGAEWDVGVLSIDSEYESLINVQVVGDWRIAALARIQPGYLHYSAGERGYYERCVFQGYRGALLRASDVVCTVAATTTTIDVPLTTSNYLGTTGTLQATGGTEYSWTGTSSIGGGLLRLTGVTPDASSLALGTMLRGGKNGSGVAGTQFIDCLIHGLCHKSGQAATALGWSQPSLGLEVDGYPLRGLVFINTKVQTMSWELGNTFLGNCEDMQFFGGQFETGSIIGTPIRTDQVWASYPIGDTRGLVLFRVEQSSLNTTAWTPRTYYDHDTIFPSSQGTSSTQEVITSDTARPIQLQNVRQITYNDAAIGYINAPSSYSFYVRHGSTNRLALFISGNFAPGADNAQTNGTAGNRWSTIFAGTGTINTSDAREKEEIASLDDAERRVALKLKGLLRKFKFKDAVANKGDAARVHSGIIAQDVIDAFTSEGLDANRYALLCHDTWDAQEAVVDQDGNVAEPAREAGDRYGVRYEELFSFILAAL